MMFAITKKDIESIRLLRKAGASLTLKNNSDFNAEDMAEETKDKAVIRALDPDKVIQLNLAKIGLADFLHTANVSRYHTRQ